MENKTYEEGMLDAIKLLSKQLEHLLEECAVAKRRLAREIKEREEKENGLERRSE